MKKPIVFTILIGITLLAAYLGWFAQDIAYYFQSHLFYVEPFITLIIVTAISICLFVLAFIIEFILYSIKKIKSNMLFALFITNIIAGIFISLWSLFVLVMWWG
ncbi:hypothetical protein ACFFIS_06365 [Virgibacillus soli]|uniref:hypothetical protein n=1 Tax=Paracerasibacillus soli TaxID=480284 RepID=UPI0035E8F4D3